MCSISVCYLFFLLPILGAVPIKCVLNEDMRCENSSQESVCVDGEIHPNISDIEAFKMKCACKAGFYRSYLGECLPEEYCGRCKGHHEFFTCGPECDNVCATLLEMNRTNCPIVNIVCNERCYCEDGYARNYKGDCIPAEECFSHNRDARNTKIDDSLCSRNEEHTICKRSCPPDTCISLVARFKCDSKDQCRSGCVCKAGFLRTGPGEPCVPISECPEVASSPDHYE